MIKTLNPSPANEYEELAKVDFLTGDKKSEITLTTFFNFLISKKLLPQSEYVKKVIKCSSSDAKNDILKISVNNRTVYIDLFSALIEINGYISTTEKSGNWSMKITTAQKSSDSRCEKNSTFIYRCCSGTSWTKELTTRDISTTEVYENLIGNVIDCEGGEDTVVSVKTFNSLIKAINQMFTNNRLSDGIVKDRLDVISQGLQNGDYCKYSYYYPTESVTSYEKLLESFPIFSDYNGEGEKYTKTVSWWLEPGNESALNWILNNKDNIYAFVCPDLEKNTEGKKDSASKALLKAFAKVKINVLEVDGERVHLAIYFDINKTESTGWVSFILPCPLDYFGNQLLRHEKFELIDSANRLLYFDRQCLSKVEVADLRAKDYHNDANLGYSTAELESLQYVWTMSYFDISANLLSLYDSFKDVSSYKKNLADLKNEFVLSNQNGALPSDTYTETMSKILSITEKAKAFVFGKSENTSDYWKNKCSDYQTEISEKISNLNLSSERQAYYSQMISQGIAYPFWKSHTDPATGTYRDDFTEEDFKSYSKKLDDALSQAQVEAKQY